MNHELKTDPKYYQGVIDGKKRFELRKNDRDFSIGDVLRLREYDPQRELDPIMEKYTGRYCYVRVEYLLKGVMGLKYGYCILGISETF